MRKLIKYEVGFSLMYSLFCYQFLFHIKIEQNCRIKCWVVIASKSILFVLKLNYRFEIDNSGGL